MPPGLLRRMVGVSLLLHGALLVVLLAGVRLHLPGRTPPEPRVTVKFDKAARPQRPALERSRRAGPVSRPLVRVAGRVQQPAVGVGAAGPGSRGSGGGAGGGHGEGLGNALGMGGGLSGPVGTGEFPSGSGLGPLYTPGIGTGGGGVGGPGLAGARAGSDEVDLGVELLGVEALDTGRHRALVVVDPQDRRRLKGFLYLSGVYSPAIERAELESPLPRRFWNERPSGIPRREGERQSLQGLADQLTEQTQVRAEVLDELPLDDPRLLQVPFLLLTALRDFEVTPAEAASLGRYLLGGGFVYLENAYTGRPQGNGATFELPALRHLVRQAFAQVGVREGKEWAFVRLPMDHPLFHCYYDISSLPLGWWDWTYTYHSAPGFMSPPYLEGIELHGQLAGVLSLKDYADFWAGEAEFIRTHTSIANERFTIGGEELPVYRLGVNVLVYALTRDGRMAQRLVAAE